MMFGACLLSAAFLHHRSVNEMAAQEKDDLNAYKLYARTALRAKLDCRAPVFTPCVAGSTIQLLDRAGKELVATAGTTKIGKWNVKAQCLTKTQTEFWIMLARPDGAGGFRKDPLSGAPLGWTEAVALSALCQGGDAPGSTTIVRSAPCYASVEGSSPLPAVPKNVCKGCSIENTYCGDDQREFPLCPAGYKSFFHYSDRYGWGGVDLSKYTLCRKVAGP
jgi:hypothetical protein